MRVFIDDRPAEDLAPPGPGETFGQVFGRLMARVKESGRTVTSVEVDGEELTEDLAETVRARAADSVDQVRVKTADLKDLSASLLAELSTGLGRLGPAGTRVAARFQSGETTEALAAAAGVIEAWQIIVDGIQQVARLTGTDLHDLEIDGRPMAEHLESMVRTLREFSEAFKRQDYVAIGDAFGYDLQEQVKLLEQILKALAGAEAGNA